MTKLLVRFPELELRWLQHSILVGRPSYDRDFAVIAAQNQDKLWPVLELLFDLPLDASRDDLVAAVSTLGLDIPRFVSDLDDPKTAQRVTDQHAWCLQQGLDGAPAFVLGNQKFGGSRPLGFFIKVVSDYLGYEFKSLVQTLKATIQEHDVTAALAQYHQLKATQRKFYNFDENELNELGYQLLDQKRITDAIAIFKLNLAEYPSGNMHDSLAEAYLASGNRELAKVHYQRAIELDPSNENARKVLASLTDR